MDLNRYDIQNIGKYLNYRDLANIRTASSSTKNVFDEMYANERRRLTPVPGYLIGTWYNAGDHYYSVIIPANNPWVAYAKIIDAIMDGILPDNGHILIKDIRSMVEAGDYADAMNLLNDSQHMFETEFVIQGLHRGQFGLQTSTTENFIVASDTERAVRAIIQEINASGMGHISDFPMFHPAIMI